MAYHQYEIVKKSYIEEASSTDIYIISMNTKIKCLKVANVLKNNGYKVEVEKVRNKLKKGLDYGNKQGIRYVIIIGEDELKDNTVVKDMFNMRDSIKENGVLVPALRLFKRQRWIKIYNRKKVNLKLRKQ